MSSPKTFFQPMLILKNHLENTREPGFHCIPHRPPQDVFLHGNQVPYAVLWVDKASGMFMGAAGQF